MRARIDRRQLGWAVTSAVRRSLPLALLGAAAAAAVGLGGVLAPPPSTPPPARAPIVLGR